MNFKTIKKLSLFLLLSAFMIACESYKELKSNSLTKIEMDFTTRGNATHFEITQKKTTVSSRILGENVTEKEKKNQTTDSLYWTKVQRLVSDLDLRQIENWEAPSQDFTFDGARATTIRIDMNGTIYTSNVFDEGKPPAELEMLYNMLVQNLN